MAYQYGLSQQFERQIKSKIEEKASQAVLVTLEKAADALIADIDRYWLGNGALDFLGVTGNAYTSVTIGIYQKKKLVYANWNGKHVKKPTMQTLKEGEAYPLPAYYDGDSAGKHPYVGEYGNGGQWGPQLGPWAIYSQRYNKAHANDEWTVVVAVPVSYAGYNLKIVHALQHMLDALPKYVDSNIVRVEDVPVQTEAFEAPPF